MANGSPTLGFKPATQRVNELMGPLGAAPLSAPATSTTPETEIPIAPRARPASTGIADNPFSRIGLILSNVAAGMRGQELPTTRMKRLMLEKERQELQTMQMGVNAMKTGAALIQDLSPTQREIAIQQYGGQWEKVIPGFTAMFSAIASDPRGVDDLLPLAGALGPEIKKISGNNRKVFMDIMTNKTLTDNMYDGLKDTRGPTIAAWLKHQTDKVRQIQNNPRAAALFGDVPKDPSGNWMITISDLARINENLPPNEQLEDIDLAILRRHPEMALQYGVMTPDLLKRHREEQLKPDERVVTKYENGTVYSVKLDKNDREISRVEIGAKPFKPETTPEIVRLQGQRDAAIRRGDLENAQEIQNVIDAKGAGGTAEGEARIAESKSEARAFGKKAGQTRFEMEQKLSEAIPSLLRITGEPDQTVREWKQKHRSIPEEKQMREIEASEAAVMSSIGLSQEALRLAHADPTNLGAAGWLKQWAADLKANAINVMKLTGYENIFQGSVEDFSQTFEDIGVNQGRSAGDAAVLKSILLDLAYTVARSRETQGQLTNKDLDQAIRTIGANIADLTSFSRVMNSFIQRTETDFANRVKSVTGVRPPPVFPKTLPKDQEAFVRSYLENPDKVSEEEIKTAISAGLPRSAVLFMLSEQQKRKR